MYVLLVAVAPAGCGGGSGDGTGGSGALGGNHPAGGSQGAAGSSGTGGSGATGGGLATGGSSGAAGSVSSGACGQVEPCGGEVDGVWNASSACVNNTAFMLNVQKNLTAGCGLVAVASSGAIVTGSIGFSKATMTYTSNLTETVTVQFNIPMACLSGQTCAQYGAALQQQSGTLAATCSGATTCACTYTAQAIRNESGTYAAAGTAVILTSNVGSQTASDYCVLGTSLHLVDVDTTSNLGPNGQATITDDSVFTKE